jgi:hypothetical protein
MPTTQLQPRFTLGVAAVLTECALIGTADLALFRHVVLLPPMLLFFTMDHWAGVAWAVVVVALADVFMRRTLFAGAVAVAATLLAIHPPAFG